MLGVHFVPKDDGTPHIQAMRQKGIEWADRLTTHPLPASDAWLSFTIQLHNVMSYGLGEVIIPPKRLKKLMHALYYWILPILNINRFITREWRTLPERYQELGLPEWGGDCLAAKIFLIQRLWGFESASTILMTHAYEAFQMEVGLFGDISAQD